METYTLITSCWLERRKPRWSNALRNIASTLPDMRGMTTRLWRLGARRAALSCSLLLLFSLARRSFFRRLSESSGKRPNAKAFEWHARGVEMRRFWTRKIWQRHEHQFELRRDVRDNAFLMSRFGDATADGVVIHFCRRTPRMEIPAIQKAIKKKWRCWYLKCRQILS